MFRSLIEAIHSALGEGPEGHRLMPWNKPDKKTLKKNLKMLQGLDGYRRSSAPKVLVRGISNTPVDKTNPDNVEIKSGKPHSS